MKSFIQLHYLIQQLFLSMHLQTERHTDLIVVCHCIGEKAFCSADCRDQEIMIEEEAKNKIAIRCLSCSSLPTGGWNGQQRRTWTWLVLLVLNNVESHMRLTGSGNISGIPVQCSCSSFAYPTSSSPRHCYALFVVISKQNVLQTR